MKAKEFVARLRELAPAKSVLLERGYGNEEADEYIDSFACCPRSVALGIETNNDSMLELMNEWDLSRVEIGGITFHSEPVQFDNQLEIGTLEGDRIAYRLDTRDYVLLDWQNLKHVMCEIAPHGDSFLDGLSEIAGCCAKSAIEEIDLDDENVCREYKAKCVQAFGGSKYETFCTSILGV
jgi:hypothetical protein